jgi:MerR family mercuric resistance operon transcriptional regulator
MKISEAAAASGCNLETIRYYERIGLLTKALRKANNYRDYTAEEVARLKFVTRGRDLGFSLEEIRSLLTLAERTDMPCGDIDQLARKHLADILDRIRELQRMADELKRTISACAGGVRARCAILGDLRSSKEEAAPKKKGDRGQRARQPRLSAR